MNYLDGMFKGYYMKEAILVCLNIFINLMCVNKIKNHIKIFIE